VCVIDVEVSTTCYSISVAHSRSPKCSVRGISFLEETAVSYVKWARSCRVFPMGVGNLRDRGRCWNTLLRNNDLGLH
jgi:hypothetical protein